MKSIFLFALSLVANLLAGQSHDWPPALTAREIKSARESLILANRQLQLEAYLSVDYMPTTPSTGPRPRAVIYIRTVNKTDIPSSVTADAIWIEGGGITWSAWLPEASPHPAYDTPDKIHRVMEGHPFPPNSSVDVFARLTHSDKTYFLKVADVIVRRTE
jgi:hypothetical protein